MKNNEKIVEFFNRVGTHTNVMKGCDEKIFYQIIVEKILRTQSRKFDRIVVAIEESKKIEELGVQELQACLEVHEQRLNERESDQPSDNQVLPLHNFCLGQH